MSIRTNLWKSCSAPKGCWPWANISVRRRSGGQAELGSEPESALISICWIPAGRANWRAGWPASAFSIKLCQIGDAPLDPATCSISVLSALPTHTPTTSSGVYPMVHASR